MAQAPSGRGRALTRALILFGLLVAACLGQPSLALLLAPLNPRRDGGKPALRFRCARIFGYGASPEMVRRCFERCDADRIRGQTRILRVLADTDPVQTQGPVWHLAGRTI